MSKPAKKSTRERLVKVVCGLMDERERLLRRPEASAHYWNGDGLESIAGDRDAEEWVDYRMAAWLELALVRAAILKRSAAPKAHGPRAAKRGGR